jgi:hypothetical protein
MYLFGSVCFCQSLKLIIIIINLILKYILVDLFKLNSFK